MQQKSKNSKIETPDVDAQLDDDANQPQDQAENATECQEVDEMQALKDTLQQREDDLAKEKKEYLFLMAEFDNFRKRTLREKSEIIKNGAETALRGLLPILDDFERGLAAITDSADAESVKEGMTLIYNKFVKYLEQNGVKEIPTDGADFNPDFHEAIAMVPADDEHKGKIIDTVTKGYMLNDKVIRHAKVAVGQ
jgi:molecular chaperone GrpE